MDRPVAIYARVSTAQQDCERQVADLEGFAARAGFRVVAVVRETASGRRDSRPERKRVLALAQRREIEAVLVTELSRWGRSTVDLIQSAQELAGRNVSILALNGGDFDLNTASGKAMISLFSIMAQFESDLLSERVKSGLAQARAKGRVLGRRQGDRPKVEKYQREVRKRIADGRSQRWIAKDLHISRQTVARVVQQMRAAEVIAR